MLAASRRTSAERRDQISDAALRILAEGGTARLTARNIARAVGMTDGALFKHFPDKQSIISAAIDKFEALLLVPALPASIPPLDRLGAFFTGRLARIRSRPELLELAFSNSLESAAGPEGSRRVRRVIGQSLSYLRRCLRDGQNDGTVARRTSARVLAWMVHGVIQAAARQRLGVRAAEDVWSQVIATIAESEKSETKGDIS